MGPRVTWIEEKAAEGAGEPRMGAGGEQLCGHLGGSLEARPIDLCFEVQMGFAWAEVVGQ